MHLLANSFVDIVAIDAAVHRDADQPHAAALRAFVWLSDNVFADNDVGSILALANARSV